MAPVSMLDASMLTVSMLVLYAAEQTSSVANQKFALMFEAL